MDDLFLRKLRRICRVEHRPFPVACFVLVPVKARADVTSAGVHNEIVIVVLGFAVFRDDGAVAAVQRLKMEIHRRTRGVHIAHLYIQRSCIPTVVGDDEVIRTIDAHGKIRRIALHYRAVRHRDGLDAAGRIAVLRLRVGGRHMDGRRPVRPDIRRHGIFRFGSEVINIAHLGTQRERIAAVVRDDEVVFPICVRNEIRGTAFHHRAVRHRDGLDAAGRIAILRLRVRSRHTDGHRPVRPVTGHHLIVRGRRKPVDVAHFYGVCQNVAAVIPHREIVHAVFVHRVLRLRSIHDAAVRQGDVSHARQVIVRGQVDIHRPVRPVIRGQVLLRHRLGLLEHEACKNGVGHIPCIVLRLCIDVSEVFLPHGGLVQLVIGQPIGFERIFICGKLVIDGLDAAVRPAFIGQIVGQQLRTVYLIEMRIAEHPRGRVVHCRMQDIVHHGPGTVDGVDDDLFGAGIRRTLSAVIRIRGHALHVVLRPQIVRAVFRDVGENIAVLPLSGAVRRARHRILPKAGFRIMGFYRDGLALAPALVPLHRINDRRMLVDVVDDERIRLGHIAGQVAGIGVVAAVLGEDEGRFRRGIHPGDRVRGMTAFCILSGPFPADGHNAAVIVLRRYFCPVLLRVPGTLCLHLYHNGRHDIQRGDVHLCGSGNIPRLVRRPDVVDAVVVCLWNIGRKVVRRGRFFLRGDRIAFHAAVRVCGRNGQRHFRAPTVWLLLHL